jgi:purine-binding chemotaxis protein CheW
MASPALVRALDFESPLELVSRAEKPSAARLTRVLLFTLAGRTHCAPLGSVREIIPMQQMTTLPGAPRQVRGLINLRGTIVTVLDATMSEYGVPSTAPEASILLVERGSRVAGVVVDEVHDIGLLEKDVSLEALIDLSALVQMALA